MQTRLAPSPTGALHLGNARTFLVNWALARRAGWRIVLRIEDLDGPRIKPGADREAIDTLRWLGIDWDEGPFHQRRDLSPYRAALQRLGDAGLIYRCRCTRSEIAAAQSAPHADDPARHELRYPGTCRPPAPGTPGFPGTPGSGNSASTAAQQYDLSNEQAVAWRLRVPDEPIRFHDRFAGPQAINVQRQVGDFIVATRAGLPAYQLAVVVDDAAQGVTHVVRGDDLIDSTPRQILLYRLLDLGDPPAYLHLPLVRGEDGRRLAKRHGDTRLTTYRRRGVGPERIVGLIAEWSGLGPRRPTTAAEFAERFDLQRLPREPITFTQADDRWLMEMLNDE